MPKQAFAKLATTVEDQLKILRSRGMQIDDESVAIEFLQHVSYYRLAAYWRPLELDSTSHVFQQGSTFEDVAELYTFDRELRLLLLDAIEHIEVSFRCNWAHNLALEAGPHAHLDQSMVKNETRWRQFLGALLYDLSRSREVFIQHLQKTYDELTPPIWAVSEVLTLGTLSKWYENIGPKRVKSRIANNYHVNEQILESWCRHLTYVRNICAHHSRLWNRDFTITPAIPKSRTSELRNDFVIGSRGIYNTLVIVLYLVDQISPRHNFRERLFCLINNQRVSITAGMGFPDDWQLRNIWKLRHP
jgi:abortive infection bacteriophage resistance protein